MSSIAASVSADTRERLINSVKSQNEKSLSDFALEYCVGNNFLATFASFGNFPLLQNGLR